MSSAIIDATPKSNRFVNNTPFYFLFALSLASYLWLVFFVNVKKSRVEQAEFLEREAIAKRKMSVGESGIKPIRKLSVKLEEPADVKGDQSS